MSNIKELMRQEIERRKKVYLTKNGFPKGTFGAIKIETYEGLLAFIDSLPEEKHSEDLVEAAEEYADKHGFRVPYDGSNNYYDDVDVKASKEGFIAGAEWMRKKDVEDMYMSDNRHFLKCYEQGKVDMKVEMMKDVVEGFIFQSEDYYPKELVAQYNGELKHGDKVKIIIVKQ